MTERPPADTPAKRPAKRAKAEEAPRRGYARAVADIVPDIGRAAFRKFGFVQSSVVSRWPEIVGPRYAEVSTPESIRFPVGKRSDGVLNLLVESAHAPMMQHVAPSIVERVNLFFGYPAVARIAMRQGAAAKRLPRAAPPSLKPIPADLGDSLRAIVDPELKAVLESLARGLNESSGPVVIGKIGRIG